MLQENILTLEDIITVRCGELAFNPFAERVEPAATEFIKIAGKGSSWECRFYEPSQNSCTIHAHRPLECRLLKCWDTQAIQEITGKDCLTRYDIVSDEEPLYEHIASHEKKCSYPVLTHLMETISYSTQQTDNLKKIKTILQEDLALREKAIRLFHLSLPQELFYFGRPMFQTIKHPRLNIKIVHGGIKLDLL